MDLPRETACLTSQHGCPDAPAAGILLDVVRRDESGDDGRATIGRRLALRSDVAAGEPTDRRTSAGQARRTRPLGARMRPGDPR